MAWGSLGLVLGAAGALASRRVPGLAVNGKSTNCTCAEVKGRFSTAAKFGGSSLADADRLREVYEIVKTSYPDEQPVLILSAMGKTTNNLLEAGRRAVEEAVVDIEAVRSLHTETVEALELDGVSSDVQKILGDLEYFLKGVAIIRELSPRSLDYLVSFGERLSTRIFAEYCRTRGLFASQVDAFEAGMVTDDGFGDAQVLPDAYERLGKTFAHLPEGTVPVVTGFLGRGKGSGAITTLGRGGSDLTATTLGKALHLSEVHVWKDVDGLLTADPRRIPNAQMVPYVSFEEANELAFFGAKVLHPISMKPAMDAGITVRVRNSYNMDSPGTSIKAVACSVDRELDRPLVTSLVTKTQVTLVAIESSRMIGEYGFLSKVFSIFDEEKCSVDTISTSEVAISLTLSDEIEEADLARLTAKLKDANFDVSARSDVSLVSIICNSCKVMESSAVIGRACSALSQEGIVIEMASIGSSKLNVGLVVAEKDCLKAVEKLHQEFFPEALPDAADGHNVDKKLVPA
jgi:aspartate kinase